MSIRRASLKDFNKLYALGEKTPELRVSAIQPFMHPTEFKAAIKNRHGVFLCAREGKTLQGFIYINTRDIERTAIYNEACLVYLVVAKGARGKGMGQALYATARAVLKKKGITHIYAWVTTKNRRRTLAFMKKQGFAEGGSYVWMDREI
ncbi:MAG: GNAT family N-acetyltransferase [Candidatus Magasanikbacteria bacterium]|nr:GNAT family N-acetyltransferase [Candidatus Magasanikbacteria bacterium]